MAEGAPLLREYVGKTCIEGSNPSGSARPPINTGLRGPFSFVHTKKHTKGMCACAALDGLQPQAEWADADTSRSASGTGPATMRASHQT